MIIRMFILTSMLLLMACEPYDGSFRCISAKLEEVTHHYSLKMYDIKVGDINVPVYVDQTYVSNDWVCYSYRYFPPTKSKEEHEWQ